MVIADSAVVRKLAGNRSVQILPEDDITGAIVFADSLVQTATGKYDWDSVADPGYATLKKAAEYFASSELLSRWQDQEEDSKEQWERGEKLIQSIKDNFAAASAGEENTAGGNIVNIVTAARQTSPLNPAAPYRRWNGRLADMGSEGIDNRQSVYYWF